MKLPIFYRLLLICFALFCFMQAFPQTEIPLKPLFNYTYGFASTGGEVFEIGLLRDLKSKDSIDSKKQRGMLKFGIRLPDQSNSKELAQIDKATANYLLFFSGELLLKDLPVNSGNKSIFWSIEPALEYGLKKYEYHPDTTNENSKSVWKNNWAIEVKTRYFTAKRQSGAWQWGFYGRFRVSDSHEASSAIQVLESGNVINDYIVSEPLRIFVITPAFGINLYPGTDFPFSVSPVFYYYWTDQDNSKGFELEQFRAEQWVYFYPVSIKNIGLRIGFGLFESLYTKGMQDDKSTIGGMVSIKMESNILKSVF
ncbi:MAG: hypothetical protein JXB24_06375 [Bacteroidales bacterium]|nr:hypothetical protein [Bacteroidales bacterium]